GTGKPLLTFPTKYGTTFYLWFSPDGRFLLSMGGENDAPRQVWDANNGKLLHTLASRFHGWGFAFSRDGRWLVTCPDDGAATVWDTRTGEKVREVAVKGGGMVEPLCSADSRLLLVQSGWKHLEVWDTGTWERRFAAATAGKEPLRAAFSPDGRSLAATNGEDWVGRGESTT